MGGASAATRRLGTQVKDLIVFPEPSTLQFQRFEKYGLKLHPEKTRLLPFARPETVGPDGKGPDEPGTFDFLGFTHYWGKSWKGHWVIKRKTATQRLRRTLKALGHWCRINRHRGMFDQFRELVRKLAGHYAYYGITGNPPRIFAPT